MNMMTVIAVSSGGVLGVLLRYGCYHFFGAVSLTFPTLVVNSLGCFLLGVFIAVFQQFELTESMKLALVMGCCGGLTTFSTFIYDIFRLLQQQAFTQAVIYFVFSNVLGVALFGVGFILSVYLLRFIV